MAGSTRIKGTKLQLKIDATDYWADVTSVTLENEEADGDVTTFEDASLGGAVTYFLNITAIQSTATASFWRMVWENTGDEVAFIYAPHGNATASATEPHFTGTVKIGSKPFIGGEAGTTYTFETRMDIIGVPTMVTA